MNPQRSSGDHVADPSAVGTWKWAVWGMKEIRSAQDLDVASHDSVLWSWVIKGANPDELVMLAGGHVLGKFLCDDMNDPFASSGEEDAPGLKHSALHAMEVEGKVQILSKRAQDPSL